MIYEVNGYMTVKPIFFFQIIWPKKNGNILKPINQVFAMIQSIIMNNETYSYICIISNPTVS